MSDMDPGVSSPSASPGGNLYTWLVMQAERTPEAIAIAAPGRRPSPMAVYVSTSAR